MKIILKLGILILLVILIAGCSKPEATAKPTSIIPATTASTSSPSGTPLAATTPAAVANRVDFVYFHPKIRCSLCISVEILIKSFLEKNYGEELKSGKITFTSYSLEDKDNSAIVKKFKAYSSQFFVNNVINGKDNIEHVEKVWMPEIYNDGVAFENYMKELVSKSLEAIK
jgi:hypothetical protein